MKFTVKSKDIKPQIITSASMLDHGCPNKLLQNILFEIAPMKDGDSFIKITGGDIDNYSTNFALNINMMATSENHNFLIPPKIKDIIALTKDENEIYFEITDSKAIIQIHEQAQLASYRLATIPADNYPRHHNENEPLCSYMVKASDFHELIKFPFQCVSTKDPRKVLLGVCLEMQPDGKQYPYKINAIGTDGKVLGFSTCEILNLGSLPARIIVPAALLNHVISVAGNNPQQNIIIELYGETVKPNEKEKDKEKHIFTNIKFTFSPDKTRDSKPTSQIIGSLINGTYPNYQNVIPKEFVSTVKFNRQNFIAAIKKAAILTDDKFYGINIIFTEDEAEIQSNVYDLGSFSGQFPIENDGEHIRLCFNYKTILKMLSESSSTEIIMQIKSSESPCILRQGNNIPLERFFMLMPIKLSDAPATQKPDYNEETREE